jgi:hypothetical protein
VCSRSEAAVVVVSINKMTCNDVKARQRIVYYTLHKLALLLPVDRSKTDLIQNVSLLSGDTAVTKRN